MRGVVLGLTAAALLVASPSMAGKFDPVELPTIGGTAPAFGLTAFRSRSQEDDARDVVQLDDHCGMRPGDTSTVLVAFVSGDQASSDLGVLTQWQRKYSRDGLVVLAISTDPDTAFMSELVAKTRGAFPVLDDQYTIVSRRYGITGAPFTLLLDSGCRVLGMGDKAVSADSDRIGAAIDERAKATRAARK